MKTSAFSLIITVALTTLVAISTFSTPASSFVVFVPFPLSSSSSSSFPSSRSQPQRHQQQPLPIHSPTIPLLRRRHHRRRCLHRDDKVSLRLSSPSSPSPPPSPQFDDKPAGSFFNPVVAGDEQKETKEKNINTDVAGLGFSISQNNKNNDKRTTGSSSSSSSSRKKKKKDTKVGGSSNNNSNNNKDDDDDWFPNPNYDETKAAEAEAAAAAAAATSSSSASSSSPVVSSSPPPSSSSSSPSRPLETLVTYPTSFTIKVIGLSTPAFLSSTLHSTNCLRYKTKTLGKYVSITAEVYVYSAEQLYQIYGDVERIEGVKFKF